MGRCYTFHSDKPTKVRFVKGFSSKKTICHNIRLHIQSVSLDNFIVITSHHLLDIYGT